jgi:hypothetical protein
MEPTLKEGDRVYLIRKNIKTERASDKLDHKKLRPYKISKVVGRVNYKLQLPPQMRIHPVFHISLLEKAPPGAPPAPDIQIEPINPDQVYEVETILDHKQIRKKTHYLIRWKGYPDSENTWEPVTNLQCPELLDQYHQQPKKTRMGRPGRHPTLTPGR